MKNKKWLIATVCMLLVSALILAGCMYAIAEQGEPSKPYDMGEAVSLVPEDAPTAQTEMEAKFAVYNHVLEVGEENTLVLFSREQAQEQWAKRQNGEAFTLTYDEIVFLINDSLRMYRTYDAIHLTNAQLYGISETILGENDRVVHMDGKIATEDRTSEMDVTVHQYVSDTVGIQCNNGDFSWMSYEGEQAAYEKMMYDVMQIATYRMVMLDSRMRQVRVNSVPCSGLWGSINSYEIGGVEIFEGHWQNGFPAPAVFDCWAMLLTEESIADEESYRDGLRAYFSGGLSVTESDAVIEYPPMLLFGFWQSTIQRVDSPTEFANLLYQCETLFPTVEVEEEEPVWELKASYLQVDGDARLSVFRSEGTAATDSVGLLNQQELALLTEYIGDTQEVMELYRTAEVSYTTEEIGNVFVELNLGNGTSLLLAPYWIGNEMAHTVACIRPTADTYKDLTFYPCLPAAFYQWLLLYEPVLNLDHKITNAYKAPALEGVPTIMLSDDGTGFVLPSVNGDVIQPVEYTLSDGRLVLYAMDASGREIFRQVYNRIYVELESPSPDENGVHYLGGTVFVYSAVESTCRGAYAFPDGTEFYQWAWGETFELPDKVCR